MKKITFICIIIALCFQMVGCNLRPSPPVKTGKPSTSQFVNYIVFDNEDVRDTEHYLKAKQVPMGEVVISDKLQAALQAYSDETVVNVGISYAAMIPKSAQVEIPWSPEMTNVTTKVYQYIEAMGMHEKLQQAYYDYYDVSATKSQIMQLTCGPDLALYVFGCPETW